MANRPVRLVLFGGCLLALFVFASLLPRAAAQGPKKSRLQEAIEKKVNFSVRLESADPFHPANEKAAKAAPTFAPGTVVRVIVEGRPHDGGYTYSALFPTPRGEAGTQTDFKIVVPPDSGLQPLPDLRESLLDSGE